MNKTSPKLISFELKVRAQVPVLKKAVLDEQAKEEELQVFNQTNKEKILSLIQDLQADDLKRKHCYSYNIFSEVH